MKSIKKLLSFVLAIALMVGMMPAMVLADEVTPAGQVRVIVANDTYVGENEEGETAAWTGTLVDAIVEINTKSTMMSAVVDALTSKGYTQVGAESNYIEEINGLAAFDGGFMSGWMTTLNDWFVDEGAGNFTVANGSLVDGDVIRFMYTLDYGADLGGSWDNQSTQLKALAVDGAQIEFAPDKYNYELEVPAEADAIRINSEAANKNFQVRKYSSAATEDSLRCTADAYALATNPSKAKFNSGYTGDQALPLAASGNTIIKVVCGDPAWPSMNSGASASVYTITVKKPVPVTMADVTIRSQAVNNYMNGFDEPVTVKSDLAESYGYTDAIPGQVSALDVLVKAHEQVFEDAFTPDTASDYLVVKDGSIKALFGEETGNCGFLINGGVPNDGTKGDWGYNGYLIDQAPVEDADIVDFILYQDDWAMDMLGYIAVPEEAIAGDDVTVSVSGIMLGWEGSNYPDGNAMMEAAEALEGVGLAYVDISTGEIIPIEDVITDEDGNATFTAPDEAGYYYLVAINNDDEEICTILNPAELKVVEDTREKVTVTIEAAPSSVEVNFFTDEAATKPVKAADITDNGVVGSVHQYKVNVLAGENLTYRGLDGSVDLGGMTLNVTEDGQTFRIVRTEFLPTNATGNNAKIAAIGDYDMDLTASGEPVVKGPQYINASNIVSTPTLLWANGNGTLYNSIYSVKPEIAAEGLCIANVGNQTFAATLTATQLKKFSLEAAKTFTLVVPSDADSVNAYLQLQNFNVTPLEPDSITEDVEAQQKTYVWKYSRFSNVSYRVTKEGETTQAGFAKDNTTYTVSFDDEPGLPSVAGNDDRGLLLNVGDGSNTMSMNVGDSFRLRAWRKWEIVNSITANIMVEPDFHYEIVSGEDVISLNPVTDKCTGNGGNNWMDVKALKPGTAVVIVSYDKIVVGGDTSLGGTYPETANENYAVAIFNVGSELAKIDWNIVGKDSWDTEFDTYYYTGDAGTFSIAPTGVESITVVSNGIPSSVEAEDGIYNVPVVEGNNLIWAEGSFGMACLPVRAAKISYTFKNNTTGESAENDTVAVKVGDSVSVTLHGLLNPIPKMSGIYNPGFSSTSKNVATLNGSYTISSAGTQYDYISSAKSVLTFDAIIPGQNVLDSFYTATSNMGDPAGNHRNTTDNGRSANFAAGQSFYDYNLSDLSIVFNVDESETPVDPSSMTKISAVEIFAGPSSYMTGFSFKNAKDSNATWASSTNATYLLNAKVTTASYYNTIELSAWYDGDDSVYTTPLQSGMGIVVPADQFTTDPTKILNIVVTVTPGDTSLAEPNVLHYMVYPGSANLKYVHPVITSLIAKDGDTDLPILPVVNTAETEYILEVGEAEKISLSAKQLQKYTNATNNKQDNADIVDVQLMKDGEPVGDAINVYPLTPDAYPVGSWALEDLDITGADQIQITVTSYVDKTTSRTYTIDLHRPATTFDVTLNVVNDAGKPTGMYAMDDATVTLLDDGTYLLRARQTSTNRNLMALTDDKYEATNHAVDWYQADDDYYFVLPLSSLEDTLVAVFSSTSRVDEGKEFGNPMYISIVPDSIKESKKPDATVDDITILPAVAAVEIRSQYADSYLHAPLGEVVESDLAESYGYTDQVVGRVSALDALVRAQELTFGDAFTAETAADYLVVADNGYVTTLFGIESGSNGFLINMAVPNDGELQDWGGYNGLTVNQAVICSGDLIDFFIYQDLMAMDSLTYIDAPEWVYTGKDITVNVSGITVGWVGYMYADGESMREDAKPLEGIKLGYLDPLTGAVEEIEGVLTDEDGNATFKAPDTEGPIHLVAISNADEMDYVLMNPVFIYVMKPMIEDDLFRVSGDTRYGTSRDAVEKLKKFNDDAMFPAAVVATGAAFADALAGCDLANIMGAPMLLADSGDLSGVVADITNNVEAGSKVYILGGVNAIPASLEATLKAKGYEPVRLAGESRFDTNLEILKVIDEEVGIDSLLVCNGWNYADALSASSCPYPILMVEDNLTAAQKAWLKDQNIDMIYAIGGTAAVKEETTLQIIDITGAEAKRLAGATRTETSIKVAEEFFPDQVETAVITYAWNFPDGLVGGPIAYRLYAPLLLAANDDTTVKSYFQSHGVEHIVVMGGTANITDKTAKDILGVK